MDDQKVKAETDIGNGENYAGQNRNASEPVEPATKEMVKYVDNTQPRKRSSLGERGDAVVGTPPSQKQLVDAPLPPTTAPSDQSDTKGWAQAGATLRKAVQTINEFGSMLEDHRQGICSNSSAMQPYVAMQGFVQQPVASWTSVSPTPVAQGLQAPALMHTTNVMQGWCERVTNATVEIVATIIGEADDSYYCCRISCEGQPPVNREIPIEKFTDGQWLRTVPGFHSYKSKTETNKYLYRYLNDLVGMQSRRNIEYLFEKPGWQTIDDAHVYATPEGVIGRGNGYKAKSKVGQKFESVIQGQCGDLKRFFEFTKLIPNSWIAAIILLYDVLSFAWQLFYDADWMVKFVLMIKGSSGVFKTSIAKLLTQVENTQTPEYHLSSTGAGMTLGFAPFRHAILLLDDLTPSSGADTIKAVENVLRAFGDGTGKQRDVSGAEGKFRKAEGGCLITAEVNPFEGSSLARMLVLPLSAGDVDVSVLTNLQKDPPLALFMFGFIQYLSDHYGELAAFIRERGEFYNRISARYSHSRLREYRIQLLMAKDVLLRFGSVTRQLSVDECDLWDKYFTKNIEKAIQYNSKQYKAQSPTELICSAIVYSIECGYMRVVPMGAPVDKDKHMALDGNSFLYLEQKDLIPIVDKFCKGFGLNTAKHTNTALASLLVSAGVALQFTEGNQPRKGTKLPGYGNIRYMKINKQKLYDNVSYEPAE